MPWGCLELLHTPVCLLYHRESFKLTFERLTALHLDSVTVLSPSFVVSVPFFDLLSRPPSFIPTPSVCRHRHAFFYVLDFIRKLQWSFSTISRHLTGTLESRFGFCRSSRWPPPGSVPPSIRALSKRILSASRNVLFSDHSCYDGANLSQQEQDTLHSLCQDSSIVIRPADKGGRWVLMDATQYHSECERQLSDITFYRELSAPASSNLSTHLESSLRDLQHSGYLSKRELAFLLPPASPQPRTFSLLPKLHKSQWSTPLMPPGRPIIADVKTDSSGVSRLIDHFLFPLVRKLRSFLLDSGHLIAILRAHSLQPHSLLCTMDVRSLYTNVPIEEGISRVRRAFLRNPDPRRPDDVILSFLRLCLTHNDFVFDQRHWVQTKGVAMGKAFGGAFACLYLAEWETAAYNDTLSPRLFVRFQDDIFMLWDHGEAELLRFHRRLNLLDPHIQTDLSFNHDAIRFLDLLIYRATDDSFGYRVGFKDTDCHNLLPRDSHHAKHVHRGVLFSQILRWATRSSSRADFDNVCHSVFPDWRSRGITRSSIRSSLRRVLNLTALAPNWCPGFSSCASPRCHSCRYAHPCNYFTVPSTGTLHPIFMRLTCSSTHVVYVILCSHCHVVYVGQTSNTLRQRISEHLRAIRNYDFSAPLTSHFTESCSLQHFTFFAIDRSFSQATRLLKELKWIRRFRSLHPEGLNRNVGTRQKVINLVTFPAACTDRLNAVIKDACSNVTDVSVRLSYKADINLQNLLR